MELSEKTRGYILESKLIIGKILLIAVIYALKR